jgi:hypothetical protein
MEHDNASVQASVAAVQLLGAAYHGWTRIQSIHMPELQSAL